MTRQSYRWLLVAFGFLSWISIGCNPATISWMLMPWMDNKIDPEYKLFAKDKELTLVITSNFRHSHFEPELIGADIELGDKLAQFFRKRCQENKHKLKIVPQAEVRSQQLKLLAGGGSSPLELGKHFKADYVLELDIRSFSIYEKNSFPKMFRGVSEITVNLHKVEDKDGEHLPFMREFRAEYPGSNRPIDASSTNPSSFRNLFLTKIARDVSKMFIAFPQEERVPFE
jgi:hypothetical protein